MILSQRVVPYPPPFGLARPEVGAWRHWSGVGGGRNPTSTGGWPGRRKGVL